MNTLCLVKMNAFELSYLKRYKTTRQVWESPEKSTPTGKSRFVFHLKMLVFIKISNTNNNQTLLANRSCFCYILFISAAQAFWVFYLVPHFCVKFGI